MTTTTTTTLRITPSNRLLLAWHRHYQTVIYALLVAVALLCVLLAWRTLSGPPGARGVAQPTAPLPIIIIATSAPVPTLPPTAEPTPDMRVLEELAALRAQVADLQAAQAERPAPQVVYQVIEAQPAPAVATPEPEQYQVSTVDHEAERRAAIQGHYVEPPTPTMAPQQAAILDRNAWAQQAAQNRAQP